MRIRTLHIIVGLCGLLLLAACHPTKFVGDHEYLLDEVRIESDNNRYKQSDLKEYIRQEANFKVFGLMKWQLYVYSWSGRNEKRWLNKQLRRIGEPPVILDTTLVRQSEEELQRFFINKGYINAEVESEIDTSRHNKKAIVTYRIRSNEPYRISHYEMNLADTRIDSIARLEARKRSPLAAAFHTQSDDHTSLVHEGDLFDRDVLDAERQRITTLLRRNGYYTFNRDNLAYLADSSFNQNIVELEMYLKPNRFVRPDSTVFEEIPKQYYIKDVKVVTDYDPLSLVGLDSLFLNSDTVQSGDLEIIYGNKKHSVRPDILRQSVYIRPGQMYNERNVEQTYSSFARLQALKNINVRFDEFMENDTMKLNCLVLTTPAKTQSFGVDLEGTNSAGDLGFASSLNYQHRNLFKGSELFSAKIRGAYESLNSSDQNIGSYWELGAETGITFPSFVFPFLSENAKRRFRATTEFKLSYSFQTRPEYQRAILSGGWSYIWQSRSNMQSRHIFKFLDIDYVSLPNIDEDFKNSLPESTRLYNFTDQFVMGTGYTYTFSNATPQNRTRNTHSLRASFEMAGNVLYAYSKLTGKEKNADNLYECFGTPFSQFVKVDVDFSKSIAIDERNRVAYRVGVGVGYPYGNTRMLPFERSYFSGGANSVRGWSVRTLGPGSMPVDKNNISFADQVGDIRLDLSVEYRTKLFWKFEMAAYIDAGNIWKFHEDENYPNANFDFSRFYKEIAVSYGLGLRLDFDFFLLRFDTGLKAYDPQQQGKDKWAILRPNFGDNFAWHFAVGYPF